MILYKSTRGFKKLYSFSEAILKGIAPGGGLFVPDTIPKISLDKLKGLMGKSYQELCLEIFDLFQTDLSFDLLKTIIEKSYSSNFDNSQISPLIRLKENQYILELWHGPTSAFKDMALQIMPYFFAEAAKKSSQKYLILVATSGDTGKAALEGYKDKDGISIIVFYPYKGVSKLQEIQMTTQEGKNLEVYGVQGNFDDVQRCVKEVFNDKEFNIQLLKKHNTVLSSANSINWGRLLPQIVYHISSYLNLIEKGVIESGDKIDIAVPTGNFGNILAAFYAKKMGLPVRKLICASNENNVLTRFLQTGIYDISNRSLIKTPSPSMDIIVASNLERLLYEITHDQVLINKWMKQLKDEKKFVVDNQTKNQLQQIFSADWVSNDECIKTIKKVYGETGYLMDPHSAVAQAVADRYQSKYRSDVPVVICSTAHWSKFPKEVYKALNGFTKWGDEFSIIQKIKDMGPKIHVPKNILDLQKKKILHKKKISATKYEIEKEIMLTFLE